LFYVGVKLDLTALDKNIKQYYGRYRVFDNKFSERWLVCRRPVTLKVWFHPRLVHVGFLVDQVALGQGFLPALMFSPVSIIPPTFHTHSFLYCRRRVILALESVVK